MKDFAARYDSKSGQTIRCHNKSWSTPSRIVDIVHPIERLAIEPWQFDAPSYAPLHAPVQGSSGDPFLRLIGHRNLGRLIVYFQIGNSPLWLQSHLDCTLLKFQRAT
jgi:hypothetical protein